MIDGRANVARSTTSVSQMEWSACGRFPLVGRASLAFLPIPVLAVHAFVGGTTYTLSYMGDSTDPHAFARAVSQFGQPRLAELTGTKPSRINRTKTAANILELVSDPFAMRRAQRTLSVFPDEPDVRDIAWVSAELSRLIASSTAKQYVDCVVLEYPPTFMEFATQWEQVVSFVIEEVEGQLC